MADQPVKQNNSDEIDLGQLFQMIGRGFNKLGIAFLKLFLYVRRRAYIFGGLIMLGAAVGYGLNQIVEKKMKIEVIVKPNLDSENYLYDVIAELNNKISSRDSAFFENIGAPIQDLGKYRISIEPIAQKKSKEDDLDYLQLLEKFRGDEEFLEIVRNELLKNSTLNHRITLTFKETAQGHNFVEKVMEYINSTSYLKSLVFINTENAKSRIQYNTVIIGQIDNLISKYAEGLGKEQNISGQISLETKEPMNVAALLQLKNLLVENTERKKMEVKEKGQLVSIVNMGNAQMIKKSFFGKNLVLLPLIFVAAFLLIEIIIILNRKASSLIQE